MNQLTVNKDKCAGCGRCQERCGFKRVVRVDETGKASFKEDRSECIECYHCLMICPNDAISHSGDGNIMVSRVDQTTPTVLTRHSCRVYKNQKLDEKVLNSIIQDANMAPRAYIDFLERKYVVVTGKRLRDLRAFLLHRIKSDAKTFKTLLRIPFLPRATKANFKNLEWCFTRTTEANRDKEQLFQGAPAVVIVTGPARNVLSRVNSDNALMQLLIRAEEQGLGTCISGYIDGYAKVIGSFLGLSKEEKVFCGAMVGYPAESFTKYIRRTDTVINWL
jgi:nitroreductase/Pyruvate/2-oxoacid:ferredoxin oxidoreductase delta subunit